MTFTQELFISRNPAENEGCPLRIFRLLDIGLSLLVIIVLLPFFAFAVAVKALVEPAPIFIRQVRVGLGGQPLLISKIRTMEASGDLDSYDRTEIFSLKKDPRVTAIGRVLRRSSLDEFPQLFSVLRGEMSLVGPRPCLREESELILAEGLGDRFSVLPGLTGLAQINGRKNLGSRQTLAFDLYWVRNRSILLYLKIIVLTPWAMVRGTGAH